MRNKYIIHKYIAAYKQKGDQTHLKFTATLGEFKNEASIIQDILPCISLSDYHGIAGVNKIRTLDAMCK